MIPEPIEQTSLAEEEESILTALLLLLHYESVVT
jgi:hypothetical protein